jgi:hypothetical protein
MPTTAEAAFLAVELGWCVVEGGHSGCLTEEGRVIVTGGRQRRRLGRAGRKRDGDQGRKRMKLFFLDDARHRTCKRPEMPSLVAVGGIVVDATVARRLDKSITALCERYEFPDRVPFKWSPDSDHWMRDNLNDERRARFFTEVLDLAEKSGALAQVAISDPTKRPANPDTASEMDVLLMALERFNIDLLKGQDNGLVIVARPQGGPKADDKFLDECVDKSRRWNKLRQLRSARDDRSHDAICKLATVTGRRSGRVHHHHIGGRKLQVRRGGVSKCEAPSTAVQLRAHRRIRRQNPSRFQLHEPVSLGAGRHRERTVSFAIARLPLLHQWHGLPTDQFAVGGPHKRKGHPKVPPLSYPKVDQRQPQDCLPL